MDVVVDQKQISSEEKAQISRQVKAELIEHLFEGCLPGIIIGIPVGIIFLFDFYHYTSTRYLIPWFIFYNIGLVILTSIYIAHLKFKHRFELNTWLMTYSASMSYCALMWGICVFLIPDNTVRQYFAIIALFILATGYATGTIGVFALCIVTLSLIIIPLIVWSIHKNTYFSDLVAVFSFLYMIFMIGINRRSTEWFKESLKLKLENTLVSYQANHDLLTNLPNQRLLPRFMESAISIVKNTRNTFALVSFSLNRTEMINDSLGHKAGDSLIQSVAQRLNTLAESIAKQKDKSPQYFITISRKDTFNIIIVPVTAKNIDEHVNKLFSVLDEPFYLESKGVKMTASAGVSLYDQDAKDTQIMIVNADAAMLQAKQFGGNRLELYRAEINAQMPNQMELETDLHDALKNKQFLLYYQPLIDLKSGKICGMEALIRWVHPVRGFISPMHFIPIAEKTGLIIPIGEWVIREACRQTKIWHQMGFSFLKVAVNLAEKQLRHGNIIETVKNILAETKFDNRFLELEITETAILDETVISTIKEFTNMGLSLAVDDFGTGYSGLSYLKRFSINKLKIDQSFIRDIPGNNDSITIVSAIIAMAKELHVRILAEGVETEEQLQFLKDKGCDYIQGYYYSKPLETDFFTKYLISKCDVTESTKN